MAAQSWICIIAGTIIRLWLYRTSLPQFLSTRSEVVTPLTSWERAMEGLALQKSDISPFSGDLFHETPLMLRLLGFFSKFSQNNLNLTFVALEIVTAVLLLKITRLFGSHLLKQQALNVTNYTVDAKSLIVTSEDLLKIQFYVTVAHSFNPYCIAACLVRSTAIFNNLSILLTLFYMLKGQLIACGFFLAMATYLSLYPAVLCVPVALYFLQMENKQVKSYVDGSAVGSYMKTTIVFLFWFAVLLCGSAFIEGSWAFTHSVYGFILSVPDLTPNLGVFWYFFTEMFEHFRTFFICVFQINAIIYTVPLSIKLREHPVFLMHLLVCMMGIFKSYPSFADVGLYLMLIPLWKHIFSYLRNTFVVTCMFICATVFAPVLHHLWIYAGSANANFYFAIALVFSTAEIFLVTDLLYAFVRRDYDLTHGKVKLNDGKTAQVVLE